MIFHRIQKRLFCDYSEMISPLNNLVVGSPLLHEKTITLQNPFFILLRIRCFRSSSSSRDAHFSNVSLTESTQSPIFPISNIISRVARSEAREALFGYLHCTRSLPFLDAYHFSKNSPMFLQKLLSKVDNERDVTRSVSKLLRDNPINEFEPFFESLGLTPPDFSSLLPRNLMFLSDDHMLLENFHVLCDFGIPRSRMGEMYKEATEIFTYDYGVLDLKLQAYDKLGFSKSTVIKLLSFCPSLLIGGVCCEFLEVLEKLKELGFDIDWMGGYLTGGSTYQWKRMLDTMEFLTRVGYSKEQMRDLFNANPSLLFEGSGKTLYVSTGRLLKLGLKMDKIFTLFLQNPEILSEKYAKILWQTLCMLFEIGMEMEDNANTRINAK